MASNYPLCAVCDSLNEAKTSVVWCSQCDQAMCTECVRRHSVTNATKGHKTVDIENYSKLPLTILQSSQTCPDHNKAYQKYCTEHESLCCFDCVLSSKRGCHNIQNIETENEEEFVKSLYDSTKLDEASMTLTPTVTSIESLISSIGTIHVTSNPHNLQYTGRQQKQAQQIVPRKVVRLEDVCLTLSKEVKIDTEHNLGCTFLDDKKYAISNFSNKSITVMKPDGSVDFQIDTNPHIILDIVYVPSSRSIIASGTNIHAREFSVHIIDIDSKRITQSIPINTTINGITHHHDNVVYCAEDRGLMRMDMKDHTVKAIGIKPINYWSCIASFNDNLYYTNPDNYSVTCCDINGHEKWEFKKRKVLLSPRQICVDGDGFVYVVGFYSNTVVVISPDGLHHAVLLTSEDGLDCPHLIDYDKNNDVLLVINFDDHNAFLFNVRK